MSSSISTPLKQVAKDTLPRISEASNFIATNIGRFNMVLSIKKTDELKKAVNNAYYQLDGMQFNENEHNNRDYSYLYGNFKSDFDNLPESIQMVRLNKLNQTISAVLTSNAPIHIRCRKMFEGFKKFHKPSGNEYVNAKSANIFSLENIEKSQKRLDDIETVILKQFKENGSLSDNVAKELVITSLRTASSIIPYVGMNINDNIETVSLQKEAALTAFRFAKKNLLNKSEDTAVEFADAGNEILKNNDMASLSKKSIEVLYHYGMGK